MKTVIISGSIRKGRQSHKVAAYVAQTLKQSGAEVDLIDPAEYPLPLLGSENKENQANIELIGSRLNEAEALIFVTPEYHGSFSGVLKNVIDHYWAEFQNKPIGVAAVSAGKLGGINASTQLQHVVLSLGAFPVPVKLLISNVNDAFDESGNPIREDVQNYTSKFIDAFTHFAKHFQTDKKEDKA